MTWLVSTVYGTTKSDLRCNNATLHGEQFNVNLTVLEADVKAGRSRTAAGGDENPYDA